MEAWGKLDDDRRASFGDDFGEECREVLGAFTEEHLLRPRHVVAGVRQAALAAWPRTQYLVGMDARVGKSLLRAMPPRMRDAVMRWYTAERLTPAAVLLETYVGGTTGPGVTDEEDLDDGPEVEEACKVRGGGRWLVGAWR
jgi:hypothetical protein